MSTKDLQKEVERLRSEVARLRKCLAPNEDPALTREVGELLRKADLASYFSKGEVWVRAADLYFTLFGTTPNVRETAALGQSLRALGWQRTVKNGWPMYRIKIENL